MRLHQLFNGGVSFIMKKKRTYFEPQGLVWNEQAHRVFTTPVSVFISHPAKKTYFGKATRVNSHEFDSYWGESLVQYRVNEYRATRGNRAELTTV